MGEGERVVETRLEREERYRFRVRFGQGGVPDLIMDEPAPLGQGMGPSPSRILSAAVGHCLSASLLFCLEKARVPVEGVETRVTATIARDPRGYRRISRIQVHIAPNIPEADRARAGRCLELFEEYCTVTQSVRQGIDVQVEVPL